MKEIKTNEEIVKLIKDNIMSVVYFSGEKCGACGVIKEKVERILEKYPKIQCGQVNGEVYPDLAANYGVFSVPVLLLYIEGKETIRVGRNVDLLELEGNIKRYYDMVF